MKFQLLLLLLTLSISEAFSQCPPPELRVESPLCSPPKNLQAKIISCDSLKLQWKGDKSQSYLASIFYMDSSNNVIEKKEISSYNYSNNLFQLTMPATSGQNISWSVESVCSINKANVYSNEVRGNNITVPTCSTALSQTDSNALKANNSIKVYPNPVYNYITVEIQKVSGDIICTITDASGKTTFEQTFGETHRITINIQHLASGSYILTINNGTVSNNVKFIKLTK